MSTKTTAAAEPTKYVGVSPAVEPQAANGNVRPAENAARPVAATAAAETPSEEPDEGADSVDNSRFLLFNALPSSLISGVLHFIVFLILALWTLDPIKKGDSLAISTTQSKQGDQFDPLDDEQPQLRLDGPAEPSADVVQSVLQEVVATTESPAVTVDVDAVPIQVELSDFGDKIAPKGDLMATVGAIAGTGLSGRSAGERGEMVGKVGGTTESEAAVAAALKWFAEHQNKDGSWSFDHRTGPCQGRCSDAGSLADCRTGATAMALLPFLGAGQTHQEGQYKEQVEKGLYFLTHQMKVRKSGDLQVGDLSQAGGNFYAHGLASIALCEAYAMTHDRKLMGPAQLSLNYIVYSQDPIGGGWRYVPRQPGDTSVVGWQLMALKSGHMAYLTVPPGTIQGAVRFLDSAQADGGAKYGYTGPGQGWGTTSVGLLCRMYLGWKQEHPALKKGVTQISANGPMTVPLANMYYNYYATQVMRQYCGDPGTEGHEMWEKWNEKMREFLVKSQEKSGHAQGSWMMRGDHGSEKGGRLYCTSMATMILEVYYRHMPIYGKQAATEDFPL